MAGEDGDGETVVLARVGAHRAICGAWADNRKIDKKQMRFKAVGVMASLHTS